MSNKTKFIKNAKIIIENINPCGGTRHARQEIIVAEIESPEAYVKEHAQFPIREIFTNSAGDTIILAGEPGGYMTRYTFTE